MAETFLERIVAATREELAARQAQAPLAELRAQVSDAPAPRDFAAALRPPVGAPARLIAEVKRASPSKGLLAETFDPVAQATAYANGGAAAISVLTEPRYFLGALDHLRAIRATVAVPVLRKDFILDAYQVYEARAAGADALLLICAMLDDATLADLLALTRSLGMEALVEAHNADEATRAVRLGARVIGVNSRDLRTFAVDTAIIQRLRPLVPNDRVFVAESGIADPLGAAHARAWGADAILVGEALMRAPDPVTLARTLASAPGGATARLLANTTQPFVKICGLTTPEQARTAAQAGADAIGLNFASVAPAHRRVTPAQAAVIVAGVRPHPNPSPARRGASFAVGERAGGSDANDTAATSATNATPSSHPSPFGGGTGAGPQGPSQGGGSPLAIGLFVNHPPTAIAEIARHVGLDAIQLSGDESPDDCALVAQLTGLPILKSVRLRTPNDIEQLDAYALASATLLVDAPVAGGYGGGGQTGDWALARLAIEQSGWPIILAGGLTSENVGSALATVGPRGVDVSSGVETTGVSGPHKDAEKIRRFIRAARPHLETRAYP